MSVTGLILQLSYRLRRHFWSGWSLSRWLGLLLVVITLAVLITWRSYWPTVIPAGIYLAYLLVLAWAGRRRYLRFELISGTEDLLATGSPSPPLGTEELVPARASGWFTVEGRDQYYVDVEVGFETVGTREHIVLGRIHPSRFLALGRWPKYELGWWYIFFQPDMIQEMRLGRLHFGTRPRVALQVIYAPDEETRQTVHFTFGSTETLHRVWDDLLLDAPPGVAR